MHPQWCQRGCLVLSALLRFFVVVGLDCLRCTAAHVCMDVLRCTAWYAADAHHSCVHAPALVTRYASPFVAMDFSCLLGSAPLRYICNYADDAHIHTNMHPQWCQRGCLVLSALLRFFAVVGLDCLRCTAAHVCMDVLHHIRMQPMRTIHAYTHPHWCQRGCLITICCHGFFLFAWICSVALH